MVNVAETIIKILLSEGVRVAAGITGQSIGSIADAMISTSQIKLCYTRQERVAVDICDGYARVSGQPAVVFTDSGPAVANTMAGIVNSYGDSIPLLFLAGQQNRFEVPRHATKELAIHDIFRSVTKWVTAITDPSQIEHVLRRAFVLLRSGRYGPVVIEIPYDVSSMEVPSFNYRPILNPIKSAGDPKSVEDAVRVLAAARNPYTYVGAGVLFAQASKPLVELAELLTLPMATTLNGKSAFPENHPLSLGIGGFSRAVYNTLQATKFAQEADVVLTIGCGFKKQAMQAPMREGITHIQIDVDASELHKETRADIVILGDANLVLNQMVKTCQALLPPERLQPRTDILERIHRFRQEWLALSMPLMTSAERPISPFRVTWELSQLVNADQTILLHDVGSVRGSTCQHYIATKPHSFIGFGVQSTMGWSMGAAIGAKLAAPDKLVVAVMGDEAFGETGLDLETAVCGGIPILIVLKNNRDDIGKQRVSPKLSAIRFKGGRNYCAVAQALGVKAVRVEDPEALRGALAQGIERVNAGECFLVEVITKRI